MHKLIQLKVLTLVALLILGFPFDTVRKANGFDGKKDKAEIYYSADDFRLVKKFDIHIHINTDETAFIDQAKVDNFRFLDIVDDRTFGLPMENSKNLPSSI